MTAAFASTAIGGHRERDVGRLRLGGRADYRIGAGRGEVVADVSTEQVGQRSADPSRQLRS